MTYILTEWARIFPNMDSKTEVWVYGILKKNLQALGVTILKTENYQGNWHFLMSVADGEIVRESYPNPYKKVGE